METLTQGRLWNKRRQVICRFSLSFGGRAGAGLVQRSDYRLGLRVVSQDGCSRKTHAAISLLHFDLMDQGSCVSSLVQGQEVTLRSGLLICRRRVLNHPCNLLELPASQPAADVGAR